MAEDLPPPPELKRQNAAPIEEIERLRAIPEATPEEIKRATELNSKYKAVSSKHVPAAIKEYRDRFDDDQWNFFLQLPLNHKERLAVLVVLAAQEAAELEGNELTDEDVLELWRQKLK